MNNYYEVTATYMASKTYLVAATSETEAENKVMEHKDFGLVWNNGSTEIDNTIKLSERPTKEYSKINFDYQI